MVFKKEHAPRLLIFIADTLICVFSLLLAYLLRFNFSIPAAEINTFFYVFPALIIIRTGSFIITKTYLGVIRYTSIKDAQYIFVTIAAGTVALSIISLIKYFFFNKIFLIPFTVLVIDFLVATFLMIAMRMAVKLMFMNDENISEKKSNVMIFGTGEPGIITKISLDRDADAKYNVVAFIDDNERMAGKVIEGIKIHSSKNLDALVTANKISHCIIAIPDISRTRRSELVEKCLQMNVGALNSNRVNGELNSAQIKKIEIEDLLERDTIRLDKKNITVELNGKTVLVTGAAGSIGSEIVRQIADFSPKKIILLDQAESDLYEQVFELGGKHNLSLFEVVIGDVRHHQRMENVFKTHQPEIVFHAAAYKHVPMMEENPPEAIRTNVLGTKIIVDLSVKYQVEKFVFISTDKAVNPTNVMGASKRVAEIYVQALNKKKSKVLPNGEDLPAGQAALVGATKFITTRFGNVLGSSGSVIPLFRKQIEKGGPVTVTHPEVTRYFMTISEACQLVLEAGSIGNGGEIFIFDMGKPIKIFDLAEKMIKLSQLESGKDIEIKFTGMRPGEKLFEELLNNSENTLPTHHPKIMIAKVREYDFENISSHTASLISLCESQNNDAIVKKLKEIIPEYVSQNSVFSKLDA